MGTCFPGMEARQRRGERCERGAFLLRLPRSEGDGAPQRGGRRGGPGRVPPFPRAGCPTCSASLTDRMALESGLSFRIVRRCRELTPHFGVMYIENTVYILAQNGCFMLLYWKCFLLVDVTCADLLLHQLISKILQFFFAGVATGPGWLPLAQLQPSSVR